MKLYFKPILLSGDIGGQGSGDEGGGEFRSINSFTKNEASTLVPAESFSLDLQAVELPVEDVVDEVASPEATPSIDVAPVIDMIIPDEPTGE